MGWYLSKFKKISASMLQGRLVRVCRPRFLSAPALRVLFAALDPRRRLHVHLLFQRPAGAAGRSYS